MQCLRFSAWGTFEGTAHGRVLYSSLLNSSADVSLPAMLQGSSRLLGSCVYLSVQTCLSQAVEKHPIYVVYVCSILRLFIYFGCVSILFDSLLHFSSCSQCTICGVCFLLPFVLRIHWRRCPMRSGTSGGNVVGKCRCKAGGQLPQRNLLLFVYLCCPLSQSASYFVPCPVSQPES